MDIRNLLPAPEPGPRRRLSGAAVEEMMSHLFAPPAVDADQVPMHGRSRRESGELRLALAVLEDALRCALRHHDSRLVEQRQAAREAIAWMRCDDDAPPFTFVRICQLFDLDPAWIREKVHRHVFRPRGHATHDDPARRAA